MLTYWCNPHTLGIAPICLGYVGATIEGGVHAELTQNADKTSLPSTKRTKRYGFFPSTSAISTRDSKDLEGETGFDPVWTTNVFALVDSYVDIFLPKNRSFAKKKSPLRLFADNSLFLFNRKQRPAARREIEPTSTRIRSDRIRDERLR
mgnify:CR=1 FL=1